MTQTTESAGEIRAALSAAEERLAQLEERHEATIERERAARDARAARLVQDGGSYRPELAAAVGAAAAEREALAEAIEAVRAEIAAAKARLRDAEARERENEGERLRAVAVAAWEALDAELMKHAPRLLKLHDAALNAKRAFAEAEFLRGAIVPAPIPTAPGVEYTMHNARPYLSGEARLEAARRAAA